MESPTAIGYGTETGNDKIINGITFEKASTSFCGVFILARLYRGHGFNARAIMAAMDKVIGFATVGLSIFKRFRV